MNGLAFVTTQAAVAWPAVFTVLGALCAALGCMALWLAAGKELRELAVFLPAAILFSLVAGRLMHWYSHPLSYHDFKTAMTVYTEGGFSLSGAFLGTALAAALCRAGGLVSDLPGLLDAAAPAAALGIAVGRLGFAFDISDRGKFAAAPDRLFTVYTPSGTGGEWRFATFLAQSVFCFALAAVLCWLFLRALAPERRRQRRKGGVFLLFLAFYGAGQIVLDSTRYDADFLRANGFIHLPQLLGGAAVLLAMAALTFGARRRGLRRGGVIAAWILFAAGLGLAGYMEYFIQRRAELHVTGYALMTAGAALACISCLLLTRRGAPAAPPEAPETAEKGEKIAKEAENPTN